MKPGDVIADRFTIERLAGSGGMGAVYLAVDRVTGGPAAVKVLWGHVLDQPEQAERFGREAEVLQELRHPGVVGYIAHGASPGGEPWLAIEWIEGESLSQRLRRKGLTVSESVALARQVAEALSAAHRRGIVHRDLKPSNLYLDGAAVDRVKVLDFGIAKVAGGTPLTMTGVVVGTPFYMSPEQARGERDIDARADVFALGCVLFHCLTGKAPFASDDVHAALLKVVLDDAPRLSEVCDNIPDALDDLVARMLAKSPRDRPSDAAALAGELAAIEASGVIVAGNEAPLSVRRASLTGRELRVVCAVLVRVDTGAISTGDFEAGLLAPTQPMTLPSTLPMHERRALLSPDAPETPPTSSQPTDLRGALRDAALRFQGRLETLPDGTLLAVVGGSTAATDHAARAARCALAFREMLPDAPMAVVAGRGMPSARLPPAEILEQGRALLDIDLAEASSRPRAIRLDDIAAGLLANRFDVGGDASGLVLRGERDAREAARTLLGKPTPFVGRDHELGILEAALDEALTEPSARAVLVTAAAGVGKSRLYHELFRRVDDRRLTGAAALQVWAAQGDPMSAGSPFGMIAQMLRREAGLRQGEPREIRRQKLRARVSRSVPPNDVVRVSQFLGELIGAPFSDKESVELRAARADPMLMGDQMRRAWEDLLVAESAAHPLILVLEDLHWGDLPSVKLLDAALRTLEGRPLLVLAFARPEVHDLFPRMWAERGVQEIHLRELNKRASEKLVRDVLGARVSDASVARIIERAAGNAFYLEELIRAAEGGESENLPETVLAMVQARLEALHPDHRRILRAASVFGQVFWRDALVPLLGDDEAAGLGERLRDLVDRELLIRRGDGRFPGQEEYVFRHSLVRDTAYAMLTEGDQKLGHRLGAEWLERVGERDATVLAEHFERAGEPERAVDRYRRAAEQALEGNDFVAAIARAERGAAYASGEVLGALRLLQAEAHKWRGSAAEAEQAAVEAMSRFALGSPLWYVAAAETGSMRLRLGRHAELAELAREVQSHGLLGPVSSVDPVSSSPRSSHTNLSSLPPGPTMGAAVSAVARLAGSLLHDGQHALAEALIEEINRVAGPVAERDYGVTARLYALHASRALCYGDPAASLQFTELSIPSFAFTGDRRNACLGRVNAAHAMLQLGDPRQAEVALRSALADAERMGLHNVSALARQNLGPALGRQGKLAAALAIEQEAVDTFASQENRRQEGRARAYLAEILAQSGDLESAEREARTAAQRVATIPPLRAFALAVLGQILLARGRGPAALEASREGLDLLLATGGMEEGESLLRLVYAESLAAVGHEAAAVDAIDVAHQRMSARAARISDPAWRASFCERVASNARTLGLMKSKTRPPVEE
jgi:serine/threonine protein kinase/tetratricopeptide (TPR) repeat protein